MESLFICLMKNVKVRYDFSILNDIHWAFNSLQLFNRKFSRKMNGPLPSNFRNLHIFWLRTRHLVFRKANKKPILVMKKVFSNLFLFSIFRRFSCWKSINFHRFFSDFQSCDWAKFLFYMKIETLGSWGVPLKKSAIVLSKLEKCFRFRQVSLNSKSETISLWSFQNIYFQIQYMKKNFAKNLWFLIWKSMKPAWIENIFTP